MVRWLRFWVRKKTMRHAVKDKGYSASFAQEGINASRIKKWVIHLIELKKNFSVRVKRGKGAAGGKQGGNRCKDPRDFHKEKKKLR